MPLTFEQVKKDKTYITYLQYADKVFEALGYKKHGVEHALNTAYRAGYILKQLKYTKRLQELAKISGYLHDIGNIVSKKDHDKSSAIIAIKSLRSFNVEDERFNSDLFEVFGAIGSHEDKNLMPPTAVAAAVIIADKTDVSSKRLRYEHLVYKDIHSKVIAACESSKIYVSKVKKEIVLHLKINTEISSIMDYFEVFIPRTIFCSKASSVLGCKFSLYINGDQFL